MYICVDGIHVNVRLDDERSCILVIIGATKDGKEELLAVSDGFYDFPAEQRIHLRTTHPIESTFATVRLRTVRTKGCGSRIATLTIVYTLAEQAEKHWRRLKKHESIALVFQGIQFVDGIMAKAA